MKTLITGATGFIGARLALHCQRQGMDVLALGRRQNPVERERAADLEAQGVRLEETPVEDRDGLRAAMARVDVVFHLAAAQHEANVPDAYFERINVEGTRNVFEAAAAAGVARVVHGSTIGVYGWRPGETVGNDSPLEPDNIYGITKLAGEEVARSFAARVPFAIARISETYGPGDGRLLKLFRGAEKNLGLLIGPGRNLHHLVYVDDLIQGLLALAREEGAIGGTFVLAGARPVTTRALLEGVARALGHEPRILRVPLAPLLGVAALMEWTLRPLGVQPPLHRRRMDFFRKSFSFSIDAAEAVGFKPGTDVDAGLCETARWYAEHGWLSKTGSAS
jgi:nucleoside-diphosphate-sugar epimerase